MSDTTSMQIPGQADGGHDADSGSKKSTKGFDTEALVPNRREAIFMAGGAVLGGGLGFGVATKRSASSVPDRNDGVAITSKEAKDLLEAGNARFVAGAPTHPDQTAARRQVVAQGQKPFAVVLACADSRVPPEVLFDQGLGDLFVVRSAGEVVDRAVLGSLQYGIEHLATPLLVVLGHSGCGAVGATVEAVQAESAAGGKAPETNPEAADGHMTGEESAHGASAVDDLVAAIRPAVVEAEEIGATEEELLDVAISINVERVVDQLKGDAVIGQAASKRATKVVGAIYDLGTGEVDWL